MKVHDTGWPNKDDKRFCHFCNDSYLDHGVREDFMIESLGAMYHHCSSPHLQAVKRFLKENKRKEKFEKYVYSSEDLNRFLENASEEIKRYLKKMDIINDMVVKQIKDVECSRKELLMDKKVSLASTSDVTHRSHEGVLYQDNLRKVPYKPQGQVKIPPWLTEEKLDETVALTDSTQGSSTSLAFKGKSFCVTSPVEPSLDTLLKHIHKEQKKGLPDKRIKANIKNLAVKSSKWKPVFHGIWSKSRHSAQKKHKLPSVPWQ
ncbi:uncharacterized protein LOC129233388 [Uloborus diversus]|nr:uncharacterized protein LOC129233388 [Uloborus diversus]